MKLSTLKQQLGHIDSLQFIQPDGQPVPSHFHITEAGINTKHFIDCGGTTRAEKNINFQVWVADDTGHRLQPQKLFKIIAASEKVLGDEDLEVEVEYQTDTIGRYGLDIAGAQFILVPKQTNCLARENCGVPETKDGSNKSSVQSCCEPGAGCC